MLLTNHKELISAAEPNYAGFYVPTGFVEAKKTDRVYSPADKADLDVKTSENLIGQIVNLSQLLNSLFWQRAYTGAPDEDLQELYLDTCKLAILSSVEIDRAKKEISIDSKKEIAEISDKYEIFDGGKRVKPTFFKNITIDNGYALNENVRYKNFDTPMDYVQIIVDKANSLQSRMFKSKTISFLSIIKKPAALVSGGSVNYRKDRCMEIIRVAQSEILQLQVAYSKYKKEDKDERMQLTAKITEKTQGCVDQIMKFDWCENSLYLMLKEMDNKDNAPVLRLLFDILFQTPNDMFFNLVKQSSGVMYDVVESNDGDARLYDFLYKKVKSVPNAYKNYMF